MHIFKCSLRINNKCYFSLYPHSNTALLTTNPPKVKKILKSRVNIELAFAVLVFEKNPWKIHEKNAEYFVSNRIRALLIA